MLAVGGIREKALAARHYGIKTFLPPRNELDLAELPPEVKDGMPFVPVETLQAVLEIALPRPDARSASLQDSPVGIGREAIGR